jgi:DNA primase
MNYLDLALSLGINGYLANKELRARCPLHADENPSFSVNVNTGLWTCFAGCGSGDFIRLIELTLGCSPQEAHNWIHNGKATSIDQINKSLEEIFTERSVDSLSKSDLVWKTRYELANKEVMPHWFLNRGFTWETIFHWEIRYDNLDDAIIIPVFWNKELVGTVTRNLSKMPKYQNSPELPKSKILFGEIFTTQHDIIICEGVLDALWLWQLGYNTVALLGTHLSQEQIEIIKKQGFGEIILAFDNDEAGHHATKEAYKKLIDAGWLLSQLKYIEFPTNKKDPQDCNLAEIAKLYLDRREFIHELKFG